MVNFHDVPEEFHLKVPMNLTDIEIKIGGKNHSFTRITSPSLASELFASDSAKARLAVLYDPMDLAEIERIFLQTKDNLIELGPCKNFEGVK